MALKELEKQLNLGLKSTAISEFDFTFLEKQFEFLQDESAFDEDYEEEYEEKYDEDFEGFEGEDKKTEEDSSFNSKSAFKNNKTERDDLDKYK